MQFFSSDFSQKSHIFLLTPKKVYWVIRTSYYIWLFGLSLWMLDSRDFLTSQENLYYSDLWDLVYTHKTEIMIFLISSTRLRLKILGSRDQDFDMTIFLSFYRPRLKFSYFHNQDLDESQNQNYMRPRLFHNYGIFHSIQRTEISLLENISVIFYS